MTGFGKIRRNALLGVLLCATLCAGFPSCSGRSEQGGETATTTAATTRETAGETAEETTDSAGGTETLYAHVQSVYPRTAQSYPAASGCCRTGSRHSSHTFRRCRCRRIRGAFARTGAVVRADGRTSADYCAG